MVRKVRNVRNEEPQLNRPPQGQDKGGMWGVNIAPITPQHKYCPNEEFVLPQAQQNCRLNHTNLAPARITLLPHHCPNTVAMTMLPHTSLGRPYELPQSFTRVHQQLTWGGDNVAALGCKPLMKATGVQWPYCAIHPDAG